jgi:dTDP-4-amino-4,6-dideoxygalactose transaminase
MNRILLSVPHSGGTFIGRYAVALSFGTAAIHLGLRLLGVGPGDEVFCPTLTLESDG